MPKRTYQRKPYNLTGQIIHKEQKTIYTGEFKGNHLYKLEILTKQQSKQLVYVFANLVSSAIWQGLQQDNCFNKFYYFTCEKGRNADFRLRNMEELDNE